jgi:hypothetical protein
MIGLNIRLQYDGVFNLPKRRQQDIMRSGLHHIATVWHREYRPKHFTKSGAREYGYQPRSGDPGTGGAAKFMQSYQGYKNRRYHHTNPLELTGESKRATETERIVSTFRQARVIMNAKSLNFRPYMVAELTTISEAEKAALTDELLKVVLNRVADQPKITVQIRS